MSRVGIRVVVMGKQSKNNLEKSINFARVIKSLKTPTLIRHFIDHTSDENLTHFYRIVANLLHNEQFANNPMIKKKLSKLRSIMAPFKGTWLKVTKSASKNPRQKRKFFMEQSGNGSILQIISTVLPLLLTLL